MVRIIGYGVEHALRKMRRMNTGDVVVFELPVPVLIQIDKNSKLGDKIPAQIKLSGRDEVLSFDITVVKMWEFDVDDLVARGLYLLLPFVLVKYRKGRKTAKKTEAFLRDYRKIKDAIAGLYETNMIYSNLSITLSSVTDNIASAVNDTYYSSNQIIDTEVNNMGTTYYPLAFEIRAEGKAEGKAEGIALGAQAVKLFIQKNTPEDIAKELAISQDEVVGILRDSGLLEQAQ